MGEKLKVAEVRERIVLPAGKDKMEVVTNDDCELVSEGGKFYVRRKKVVFPETYEECLDIVDTSNIIFNIKKLEMFQRLLICRDAYWKLGGNWKPNLEIDDDGCVEVKFCIKYFGGTILKLETTESNTILAFQTDEMRDVFYNNFKSQIEQVKELL